MNTFDDSKSPNEKLVLTFDFTDELDTGETLSGTPTVTVTTTGNDSTPDNMKNGAASITSVAVLVPIKGGTHGVDYIFTVKCDTSNANKVLEQAAMLKVRNADV